MTPGSCCSSNRTHRFARPAVRLAGLFCQGPYSSCTFGSEGPKEDPALSVTSVRIGMARALGSRRLCASMDMVSRDPEACCHIVRRDADARRLVLPGCEETS